MVIQAEIEETTWKYKKISKKINEFILDNPENEKIKQISKRKKRKRKLKEDVQRNFKCLVQDCLKSYGLDNKNWELSEPTSQTKAQRFVDFDREGGHQD